MNILFISYAEVSLRGNGVRAATMLRALADAGHLVDLVASRCDLSGHPQIRVLAGGGGAPCRRSRVRTASFRAASRMAYDAIHASGDAVFFAARLSRWKKIPLVYDAARRFAGQTMAGSPYWWRALSGRFARMEVAVLGRARIVYTPCSALASDLLGINKDAAVVQLEDVPIQPLFPRRDGDSHALFAPFGKRPGAVVVCSVLPGNAVGWCKLLMAARKVIDAVPDAAFFFTGNLDAKAGKMAANLDIAGRCVFLSPDEPESLLAALGEADAILLLPRLRGRYIHSQVYTLLHAGAPLVAIHEPAYDELLTESTSVRVLPSSEAIAEGLLRAIREPLFSLSVATEGQQLVADRYTYSSFKHKVRMTYNKLATTT